MPQAKTRVGAGAFAGCEALSVVVIPEGLLFPNRKKDRWKIPEEAQIIYRAELELSQLLAEWSSETIDPERREELRRDIRERVTVLKKRNRLHSVEPIRENLHKVALAVEEQTLAEDAAEAADPADPTDPTDAPVDPAGPPVEPPAEEAAPDPDPVEQTDPEPSPIPTRPSRDPE